MTPQVWRGLIGVVEEHAAMSTRRDLVAPGLELRAKLREFTRARELDRHKDVDRAHIGRHVTRGTNVSESPLEAEARAIFSECHHSASQRPYASRVPEPATRQGRDAGDRKSTRLNSSHRTISYAVFCLKKKKKKQKTEQP